MTQNTTPNRFLRLKAVLDRVGLAKSTIYAFMKEGAFPKPIKLTPKLVAWLESDVDQWMTARVAA